MNVYNNESKVDNEKTICNSNFHGTETKTNPITPTDNSFLHCENANQGKSLNTYKSIGQKQLLKLNCPMSYSGAAMITEKLPFFCFHGNHC